MTRTPEVEALLKHDRQYYESRLLPVVLPGEGFEPLTHDEELALAMAALVEAQEAMQP